MSRRLDNLCDDASASLFGGVTGSSSTSNPVTNTVTGAGTTSGEIEAGGNVNASNEQITGETVSQSITICMAQKPRKEKRRPRAPLASKPAPP